MQALKQLIEYLKQDKVIPVVGAGFSYAVAQLPGWKGTIENGLDYASDRRLNTTEIDEAKVFLKSGALTKGADLMKSLLNAPNHPFSDWLESLFANPTIVSDELIHAVNDLCAPIILTTNYDDLLYSKNSISKRIFDWSEHQETTRALNKKQELVLHVHGVYEKPETIILSEGDYKILKNKKGYKSVLQKLWTDYHFLFIGCSRDGVMDEDFSTIFKFLNKWFPNIPHSHFILLHESEFKKGIHRELLTQCNIESISYGNDYGNLPGFLNKLNPNGDKLAQRAEVIKKEIEGNFKRSMLLKSGKLTKNHSTVNAFLKNNLPNKIYWIDSLQLQYLEDVLRKYNENITSKKDQFKNYRLIIRGLVTINDLDEKVELWRLHSSNPKVLNNESFINLAVLAYECLNIFPKGLLEEIRHKSRFVIHEYYFDGYLGRFINQYKNLANHKFIDQNIFFEEDRYFFENLKRIIDSLLGVLKLDVDELFQELTPAKITPKITAPFLVFVSNKGISLRKHISPYKEFSFLPSESKLRFINVEVVNYKGEFLILAHNSKQCVFWNPLKDLAAVVLYDSFINDTILSIIKISNDNFFIQTEKHLLEIKDLEIISLTKIEIEYLGLVFSKKFDFMLGAKSLAMNISGPLLYKVSKKGECTPLLTKIEVWGLIKDIPDINRQINEALKLEGENDEKDLLGYPFVSLPKIEIVKWHGDDIGVFKIVVRTLQKQQTVLIGFELSNPISNVIFRILLKDKVCDHYKFISTNSGIDLICGYYSVGNYPKKMIEYLQNVDKALLTISDDSNINIDKKEFTSSDILGLTNVNNEHFFAIEEFKIIYDINIPELTYSSVEYDNITKILYVPKAEADGLLK